MKKLLFLSYLICLICFLTQSIIYSQNSGWFWLNPQPVGNVLNGIYFSSELTGYVNGNLGTILKTTNGGINWEFQTVNTLKMFRDAYFFNANTGLMTGGGIIIRTTNSGLNWTIIKDSTGAGAYNGLSFFNATTGILAKENGIIMRTTDQGLNWNSIQTGTSQSLLYTSCGSNNNAVVVGFNGTIIRTTNSGLNWNLVQSNTLNLLRSVSYAGSSTVIAVGQTGTILKSTNDGINWSAKSSNTTKDLYCVTFLNGTTGIVVGVTGTIDKTIDAGESWQIIPPASGTLFNVKFSNSSTAYAVGGFGEIIKSSDAGNTWISLTKHDLLVMNCIYFLNPITGFGGWGDLQKTTNGGINWTATHLGGQYPDIYDINFINDNIGFAVGNYDVNPYAPGMIAKTTNCGINWIVSTINNVTQFTSIGFSGVFICVAVGINGGMIRSTDQGKSWQNLPSVTSATLNKVRFTNDSKGLAVGLYGKIIKSTDNGIGWVNINSGTANNLNGLSIINSHSAFVCGNAGTILYTSDFGNNWIIQQSNYDYDLYNIFFLDSLNGWAVGTDVYGRICHTTNGGLNWNIEQVWCEPILFDIRFCNLNTGYLINGNGALLKTTNGGKPIGIRSEYSLVQNKYYLFQNYPNPFNPTTKIKFGIPQTFRSIEKITKLEIYDLLGKEVTTIVNEKLNPGTYEIEWDGSKYASGIYFYKLESGDFVQTKKLVILK